jgi:copper chaperone
MTITLNVDGMTCGGCVQSVTNVLKGVGGVTGVAVTLEPGRAVVETDGSVDPARLIQAVEAAGYDARGA